MYDLMIDAKRPPKRDRERRVRMSYDDYLKLDHDAKLIEWVHGEAIFHMPAFGTHQHLAGFLFTLLSTFVEFYHLGRVMIAPFEMRILHGKVSREPDVLFLAQANIQRYTDKRLEGPADLAVEVISGDSVTRDRKEKFAEYEEAGIREYWILDPRPHKQHANFYVLTSMGTYRSNAPDTHGVYRSVVVPGFWVQTRWFWQTPLPHIREVFKQVAPEILHDEEALQAAELRGIHKGRVEGIEQGRAEGIELGQIKGQMRERERLTRSMLATGIDLSLIMKCTGFTAEQIAEIAKREES